MPVVGKPEHPDLPMITVKKRRIRLFSKVAQESDTLLRRLSD